jgi:hypothetical protein
MKPRNIAFARELDLLGMIVCRGWSTCILSHEEAVVLFAQCWNHNLYFSFWSPPRTLERYVSWVQETVEWNKWELYRMIAELHVSSSHYSIFPQSLRIRATFRRGGNYFVFIWRIVDTRGPTLRKSLVKYLISYPTDFCIQFENIFTFGCCILLRIYLTGSLWCRQSQQSFNKSLPLFYIPSYSLHVSTPTGHLQVRYIIRYF